MARTLREEWVGKTDDTAIPSRVKVRVFTKYNGSCAWCLNRIGGKLLPRYDHTLSLINGGENRESNLQLLCNWCHDDKTVVDVRLKSVIYHKKAKHIGIKLKKSRPIPGSKASGLKRGFDGVVRKR